MASERQVEANRLNARNSTGPKTEEGKARSRGNALTHGLAGDGPVVDAAMKAVVESRSVSWQLDFRPQTGLNEHAFSQLVLASVKLDRCQINVDVAITDYAARAATSWVEDRTLEAVSIAEQLPKYPERISRQLQTSCHGCDVLIGRWDRLGESLSKAGEWSEADRSIALDLLGLHPGLRAGRTPIDAPEGINVLAHRQEFIATETARLEEIANRLAPLDASAHATARATYGAELTKPVQLLLRYEREASNGFHRNLRELRTKPTELTPGLPAAFALLAAPEPPRPAQLSPPSRPVATPCRDPESSLTFRDVAEAGLASAIALRQGAEISGTNSHFHSSHVGSRGLNRRDRRTVKAIARHG